MDNDIYNMFSEYFKSGGAIMNEQNEIHTKDDLIPYKHIVEVKGGDFGKYYLLGRKYGDRGEIVLCNNEGYNFLDMYNDDFSRSRENNNNQFEIVAIYEIRNFVKLDLEKLVSLGGKFAKKVWDKNNTIQKQLTDIYTRIDNLVDFLEEKQKGIEQKEYDIRQIKRDISHLRSEASRIEQLFC